MFVHLQQKLPVAMGNVGKANHGQPVACDLGTAALEIFGSEMAHGTLP